MRSFLGSLLTKGTPLVSCNGKYRLEIRDNGELVHLGPENELLWSSVTGIEGKEPAKPEQVGEHLSVVDIRTFSFGLRLTAGAKEQIFLQHAEVGRATQPILVVSNFGHVGIINWGGFTPLYRSTLYPDY
jgi:hypothetical protein